MVFEPAEAEPPKELKAFWQAAGPVLRRHDDPLTLDAVQHYFRELYWQKGDAAFDAAAIDGRPGILPAIAERAPEPLSVREHRRRFSNDRRHHGAGHRPLAHRAPTTMMPRRC